MKLKLIKIQICEACLDGIGDECHTPGCALWLHSVDLPIHKEFYEVLETFDEDTQPKPCDVTDKPVIYFGEGRIGICAGKYDGSDVDNCIVLMQSKCSHCIGDDLAGEFGNPVEYDDSRRLVTLVFNHPDSIEVLIASLDSLADAMEPPTTGDKPDIVTKDKVKIHSAMQRDNPKPCMSAGATEAAISEDEELASGDCPECGGKEEVCPVPSHHLYSKIRMKHNNICAACGANLFPCQQCKPDQEV